MSRAAVIGDPIAHSLSPVIFGFLSKQCGNPGLSYETIRVSPSELGEFVAKARPDFVGLNVTLPHKETILPFLKSLSAEVRAIGAANVVSFRGGDHPEGQNTDVRGIIATLQASGIPLSGKKVFLLGAGGAARAFAYAAGTLGASDVSVLNQTRSRAEKLARDFSPLFPATRFRSISLPENELKQIAPVSLIVNATSLGMRGEGADPDKALSFFRDTIRELSYDPDAAAFDMVYTPEFTPFLEAAQERGLLIVGGLGMLIEQALATYDLWFEEAQAQTPEIKQALAALLRETLAKSRRVYLCGFMGSGKSTVAALLASKLGWKCVDTDRWVEGQAGASISEIFSRHGEARFRELERQAIQAAATENETVIALGGGALMQEENLHAVLATGTLVFLSASRDSLMQRLRAEKDHRPFLRGLNEDETSEKISELFSLRAPSYARASFKIATDGESPPETAARILKMLRLGA